MQLPRDSVTHAADSAFLAEVGLEPDGGARAKGRKPSARRWRQPWHLDELRLDVIALREALAAGVLPQPGACMGDILYEFFGRFCFANSC